MVKVILSNIKKFFLGFSVQVRLSTVGGFFLDTVSHKCNSWQAVCFFSSLLRLFPGGYPLPEI